MRRLLKNEKASAIGFVIGMLVLGLVVAALAGTFAFEINNAAEDTAVAGGNLSNSSGGDGVGGGNDDITGGGIPGGPAMLGIMALMFIVIPVIIFARAAK